MANQTRTTIQDIAQSLGAPVEQVTRVILGQPGVSDDFRRRVLQALGKAGLVRVSQETKQGSLGVVIPGAVIGDYIGDVVRGVTERAKSLGYSTVLNIETASKEDDLIRLVGPGGCDGIILIVPNHYQHLLELCHQYERDYVLVDYQGDDDLSDAMSVEVENRQSIVNLMEHLFDLGHRRIGFITGSLVVASARQRLQGYLNGLQAARVAYDSALVFEGNWQHPSGYEGARYLLDLDEPPTAIVASNDLMAFGAMQVARERGLEVGHDLSITGFDDIDMAATVTPSLTTVRQPTLTIGEVAVDMLVKHRRGEEIEWHVLLDTEVIVRHSTGRAPR